MYSFAEKTTSTQHNLSTESTMSDRGHIRHLHGMDSIHHLQHTMGNHAVHRLFGKNMEKDKASSAQELNPSGRMSHMGSNAFDAEDEWGRPIGGGPPESKSPETEVTPPLPAAPAPGAPGPTPVPAAPGPAAPPAPTITSATVKAAPSGAANTRTRVGVGEVVNFTGSVAGTWTASIGTASGPNSTTFQWTAPATTSNTTATITLTAGSQSVSKTMTVVPPSTISMRNVGSHSSLVGPGGACMLTEVTIGTTDVCLGAIQWLEVPGPASSISGFFTKYTASQLEHHPNTHYALINDSNIMHAGPNNGPNDHCAWHTTAGPYSNGAFSWVIPNKYILDGESATSGRGFTNTTQHFTMNAAGTMTITKAGAST